MQAAYSATLEEDSRQEYEAAFVRIAAKRFSRFATGL